MNLPHFASRIFDTPLMIAPEKLSAILHVLGPRFDLDLTRLPPMEAREVDGRERALAGYVVNGSTAIIPVLGTLVHRTGGLDALSGLTSYQSIRRALDTALADDAVQKIVLDIDSPGGEVNGCFDLAEHIYQSRGRKPITAVVNESAYSAAYALASAAGRVVVPRTGGVGSVGVVVTHVDQANWNENAGLKVTHVFAGAQKADFSPHHALKPEAKTRLQEMVDDTYRLFVDTVARNRGISAEAVRKTEAGIFHGKKAVAAGLADEVAAVSGYLTGGGRRTGGRARMSAPGAEFSARIWSDRQRARQTGASTTEPGAATEPATTTEPEATAAGAPKTLQEIAAARYGRQHQ